MQERIRDLLSLPATPRYNIKAVVRQTQVNISTVRAWEQRYGLPLPQRSEHGHRLYSPRDVAIILWLKQCTDSGLAIRQAVEMLRAAENPAAGASEPVAPAPVESSAPEACSLPQMCARLLDDLLGLRVAQAHMLVNQICATMSSEQVVMEVFAPLLRETENRYMRDDICVADEHLVANFVRQRLLALLQTYAPFANKGRVVCGCGPGEQHELGMLMFALLLAERGWEVVYLGQCLSTERLGQCLARMAPALLCVSVSLAEHLPGLIDVSTIVESLRRDDLALAIGGRVFDRYPDLIPRMPGVFLGNDLRDALARAEKLGASLAAHRHASAALAG